MAAPITPDVIAALRAEILRALVNIEQGTTEKIFAEIDTEVSQSTFYRYLQKMVEDGTVNAMRATYKRNDIYSINKKRKLGNGIGARAGKTLAAMQDMARARL